MDIAIDRDALLRSIQPSDLAIDTILHRGQLADQALAVTKSDFSGLLLDKIQIKGKSAYQIGSAPHRLVLRRLNDVLKRSTELQSSDRDLVVRRLQTVLSEGVHHRLYKFDIKEFFDSIDPSALADQIAIDKRIPRGATIVFFEYVSELQRRGIRGIPRGIQLSATLAEYAMMRFDMHVSRLPEVYYCARFVDDIVIVTGAREDPRRFQRMIRKLLPSPLVFNSSKSRILNIPIQFKSDGKAIVGEFDYLGYRFTVHESKRIETNRA